MLDELKKILFTARNKPLGSIVHLGAGLCTELKVYIEADPEQIILVETNEMQYEQLCKIISDYPNVKAVNKLISAKQERASFQILSNQNLSSILKPKALFEFYPNIKVLSTTEKETVTLHSILEKESIETEKVNFLVVELQGLEFEILSSLDQATLQIFDVLLVQANERQLYQNSSTKEELVSMLFERGFDFFSEYKSNPPFIQLVFNRNDYFYENKSLSSEIKSVARINKNLEDDVRRLKEELLRVTKINEELEKEIVDLERKLSKINVDGLEEMAAKIISGHKKDVSELKNKIEWQLVRGFNNSVKQIESFISVQAFLETGELGLNYHGWPISSDIALFLLGRIKANNYDLVIEFGSGTSTQLFAKAIKQMSSDMQKNIVPERTKLLDGERCPATTDVIDYVRDLPQRVLTFEHSKEYFDKTQIGLKQNGLSDMVNLIHAPLVDCQLGEESFLYYDCDRSLAHIAEIYRERVAKILVLVDGPPGQTGPLARLPAMNKLLNNLGNHQLDIVLDDFNRQEEKEIVQRWKDTLEARFIPYEEEQIPCEKGAFVCRINP